MSGALGQVSFFLAIILVILIHEAAHFAAAKAFGIKVEEFFLGFGPRLWSFRKGETEYGVKLLPAGGYVRIAGMNPFTEPDAEDLPRTFGAKPIWQRAVVIAVGPATHFVLAFLLVAAWLGLVGEPTRFAPFVSAVAQEMDGEPSPAAVAGVRPGDEVVAVDGRAMDQIEFVEYTRQHVGQEVTLQLERGGRKLEVTATPVLAGPEGDRVGRLGVVLTPGTVLTRERAGFLAAIAGGARWVGRYTGLVVEGIGRAFGPEGIGRIFHLLTSDTERNVEDPVSIIGGARIAGQVAEGGNFGDVLFLFAGFNLFVGFLNLLPVLPFDGGHLAVLAVEKVRKRKVDMRKLMPFSAVVASLLFAYMLAIVYLDIVNPVPNVLP
ncbi:MAG: M50 family metallopeptidase [Actinomycetota bacterium]